MLLKMKARQGAVRPSPGELGAEHDSAAILPVWAPQSHAPLGCQQGLGRMTRDRHSSGIASKEKQLRLSQIMSRRLSKRQEADSTALSSPQRRSEQTWALEFL